MKFPAAMVPADKSSDSLRRFFDKTPVPMRESGLVEIPFGEFLVERRVLTREQLFRALSHQDRNPGMRLGESVAALGFAPSPRIDQLLSEFRGIPQVEVRV